MSTNLAAHRESPSEQQRIADLFALLPVSGREALDIGARDGYLAKRLAERFDRVTALDLERPRIDHDKIEPVKGDVTRLDFADNRFDAVLCAEVLEHIAPALLPQACRGIARVARDKVVIGVPYRQELRNGRTTCAACGRPNPPWGHVNQFDEARLRALFSTLKWEKASFVGTINDATNPLAVALLDYAGNPFGTWQQDETCVHCGAPIGSPRTRSLGQRLATRAAYLLNRAQARFSAPHGNWIHVLFSKPSSSAS